MTSSGANTWNVPLEINNLESQISSGGGSSGVQTISAGTNITITGTATNPIINSTATTTGVTSIIAGDGIAVNSATGNVTIKNTGVSSLTAGTNIVLTGSATDPIISSNSTGVQSITAGTNTTITGTATNPIINATATTSVANGKVSYLEFVFDAIGTPITIPANQIGNAFIYCNTPNAKAQTLNLPNITTLISQFGANAVVNFFIGQLNVTQFNPLYANTALACYITGLTGNEYWANNYTTQTPTSPLVVTTWSAFEAITPSVHYPALYKVQLTIQGGRAFYYFDYAGFSFP